MLEGLQKENNSLRFKIHSSSHGKKKKNQGVSMTDLQGSHTCYQGADIVANQTHRSDPVNW